MDVIATLVFVGLCKGLAKLAVKAADGSTIEEAIASELAGAAGKHVVHKAIEALADRYVSPVENHPEFRDMPDNDRESARLEVEVSLAPAIDRAFLEPLPYDAKRIVTKLYRERKHDGKPVGFSEAATSLYQQSLDAAVRAVIVVAENAKEWHAANAKAMHAKLDDLAENIQAAANMQVQILSVLSFVEQSVAELRSEKYLERRDFLERYYRAIRNTLDRMELYGLDVKEDNPARSQRLSVAYISLNLTTKDAASAGGSLAWESVLDTLEPGEKSRLLIRGDAGMGKTTLLRWAAIAIASQGDGTRPTTITISQPGRDESVTLDGPRLVMKGEKPCRIEDTWRGKVPLMVILRECAGGAVPDIEKFPSFVSKRIGDPPSGFVRWLLEQGKALVMIDGLDEVANAEGMKQITAAITEQLAIDGESTNLFLVTSRPLEQDPAWIKKLKFREAVIAPMTDSERDKLIARWHDAVAAQTDDANERQDILARPNDLIRQINDRAPIARLASVPLLCAMICAQNSQPGSELPRSEFEIIDKLSRVMLYLRDEARGVPKGTSPWDDLDSKRRVVVASRLAHYFIEQRKTLLDRPTVLGKIAGTMGGFTGEELASDGVSEAVLSRMYVRGGVLKKTDSGMIEFAHNTFKEFLAAPCFVKDNESYFLAGHAVVDDCANICRYAAGVDNPFYTERLMREVLEKPDHPHARDLVAVRMRTAAPDPTPAIHAIAKDAEARLFPLRSTAAAKAIADLGDEIVPRLAFVPGMEVGQQIMNATALSQMRSKDAIAALAAYAPTAENLTLVELLCRAINPLSIPLVRLALTEPYRQRAPGLNGTISHSITDAWIADWLKTDTGLKALTALYLNNTHVTDAGVQDLAREGTGLKALTTLDLYNTQVTDAGVAALAAKDTGLKALTTLNLFLTKVGDAGAAALAAPDTGLKALTTLNLWDTQVGDAGAAALAAPDTGLKALTLLFLSFTQVGDAGAAALAAPDTGLKALTILSLLGTQVGDAGATALAAKDTGLKALTLLGLDRTQVGDAGAAALAAPDTGLKALTTLSLRETKVGDAGAAAIKQRFPGIQFLR